MKARFSTWSCNDGATRLQPRNSCASCSRNLGFAPGVLVTDKLRSYGAAKSPHLHCAQAFRRASMLNPVQPRRICPRILRRGSTRVCLGGRSAQRFRWSLTDLADEKVSFFDAAILILSPFAGLRPSRSGVALTLNFPNPGSDTSAPLAAASTMSFKMSSTIDLACALLTPWVSESLATSSDVFIAEVPCDSIRGVYAMPLPTCHCRVIGRSVRASRDVTTALAAGCPS